jgi:2-octaprenyl-6-methoxyphenol hydroxylase
MQTMRAGGRPWEARVREGFDVAVVGGGPVGYLTAILAARAGLSTVLLAPPGSASPLRTTALLRGSVDLLDEAGAWTTIDPAAAPLRVMRIIDDTGRLVRAPTVSFAAEEIGLDAFGWNAPNDAIVAGLDGAARATAGLSVLAEPMLRARLSPDEASIETAGGELRARLAVAADGRNSALRAAAGIAATRRPTGQVALTANLAHDAPHRGVSTEFHRRSGPFTLVPLPGERSSLVAVCRPGEADRLRRLAPDALAAEFEARAHSLLGRFTVEAGPAAWPLESLSVARLIGPRVALVGEAAHVMPPIGAQGLNLGFRDAVGLVEAVHGRADPGDADALAAYERARRPDVMSRSAAVAALNESLLSPFLPMHAMRALGLWAAEAVPLLRRRLLAAGVAPRLTGTGRAADSRIR